MKYTKDLNELSNLVNDFSKNQITCIDALNKSINNDIKNVCEDLLTKISQDYNIDLKELQGKYLKEFKKKKNNKNLIDSDSNSVSNEDNSYNTENLNLLQKKKINNKVYYIDNKEGGSIYNNEVIKVGEFKNGEYILY